MSHSDHLLESVRSLVPQRGYRVGAPTSSAGRSPPDYAVPPG